MGWLQARMMGLVGERWWIFKFCLSKPAPARNPDENAPPLESPPKTDSAQQRSAEQVEMNLEDMSTVDDGPLQSIDAAQSSLTTANHVSANSSSIYSLSDNVKLPVTRVPSLTVSLVDPPSNGSGKVDLERRHSTDSVIAHDSLSVSSHSGLSTFQSTLEHGAHQLLARVYGTSKHDQPPHDTLSPGSMSELSLGLDQHRQRSLSVDYGMLGNDDPTTPSSGDVSPVRISLGEMMPLSASSSSLYEAEELSDTNAASDVTSMEEHGQCVSQLSTDNSIQLLDCNQSKVQWHDIVEDGNAYEMQWNNRDQLKFVVSPCVTPPEPCNSATLSPDNSDVDENLAQDAIIVMTDANSNISWKMCRPEMDEIPDIVQLTPDNVSQSNNADSNQCLTHVMDSDFTVLETACQPVTKADTTVDASDDVSLVTPSIDCTPSDLHCTRASDSHSDESVITVIEADMDLSRTLGRQASGLNVEDELFDDVALLMQADSDNSCVSDAPCQEPIVSDVTFDSICIPTNSQHVTLSDSIGCTDADRHLDCDITDKQIVDGSRSPVIADRIPSLNASLSDTMPVDEETHRNSDVISPPSNQQCLTSDHCENGKLVVVNHIMNNDTHRLDHPYTLQTDDEPFRPETTTVNGKTITTFNDDVSSDHAYAVPYDSGSPPERYMHCDKQVTEQLQNCTDNDVEDHLLNGFVNNNALSNGDEILLQNHEWHRTLMDADRNDINKNVVEYSKLPDLQNEPNLSESDDSDMEDSQRDSVSALSGESELVQHWKRLYEVIEEPEPFPMEYSTDGGLSDGADLVKDVSDAQLTNQFSSDLDNDSISDQAPGLITAHVEYEQLTENSQLSTSEDLKSAKDAEVDLELASLHNELCKRLADQSGSPPAYDGDYLGVPPESVPPASSPTPESLSQNFDDIPEDVFGHEWLDDDFELLADHHEGHRSPPPYNAATEQVVVPSVIEAILPPCVIPTSAEDITPIIYNAIDIFWQCRRYGESWDSVLPPPSYFDADELFDTVESTSRRVHKQLIFDLVAEVLRDIYYEEEQVEAPPPWSYRVCPKAHQYPIGREQPPTTIDRLRPLVEGHVLHCLGLSEGQTVRSSRKWLLGRRKDDVVDKMLVEELLLEEPYWVNYDQDVVTRKHQIADIVCDALIYDTARTVGNVYRRLTASNKSAQDHDI